MSTSIPLLEFLSKNLGYIVAIVGSLTAMWGWVAKPLQRMQAETKLALKAIRDENKAQTERLDNIDRDTADLLCSQLVREHDYYMQLGFCPVADKMRLEDIYTRYKARGRNHLADHFIQDIYSLPNALEDRP